MRTIIVVDDSAVLRTTIENALDSAGYEVLSTADGSPALFRALEEGKVPDAILLDMFFPEESGLDILRSLKAKYPNVKVLVITGMNNQNLNKEILESGASNILHKPFDMEDLTLALQKLSK